MFSAVRELETLNVKRETTHLAASRFTQDTSPLLEFFEVIP